MKKLFNNQQMLSFKKRIDFRQLCFWLPGIITRAGWITLGMIEAIKLTKV